MEKYGDLITNGLDLLSFLLLTPEIARVIAPAVARVTGWIVVIILPVFAIIMIMLVMIELAPIFPWVMRTISLLMLIAMFLYIILVLRKVQYDPADWLIDMITTRVSKHLFAAGMVLFLVSRLIAFYASAVKVGSL